MRGVHQRLASPISRRIEQLGEGEEMHRTSNDLAMGIAVKEETRAFIAVCVAIVGKYLAEDHLSPTFIFERLCSIIQPEEADMVEFYLSLEKDPQQEEFLQGRVQGNPYSSMDMGLGPLKNKICTDCELVALLEDDNGMELLANNKIISLDLSVKDVYQKVWQILFK